ncbi:GNAT family acetyltransferase [Staphylococcus microti]|uniref:GNAT family acetyltransferase n=1 Tax=Staphylococcus microti TaxID=569857 RepID=A0A0D6XQK2_9STAP|nr:GNAT family N-acetyltransferase [Staphylococcus microti]KIX91099.1 GNAT family acetyltransferase [Staphylococcus microti]PNZ79751.1 N-acetyltransferase [Staphylococcus microti]SUM58185.1 GNAT family acetyltransferase [Staphylococcus microti]
MKTQRIPNISRIASFIQANLSVNQSYTHKLPVHDDETLCTYLSNAHDNSTLHVTEDDGHIQMVLICTPYADNRYQVIGPIYEQGATFTESDLKKLFDDATAHHARPSTYYFAYSTAHPAIKAYMKSIGAAYTFTDYYLEASHDLGETEQAHLIIDYVPVYFRHFQKLHEKTFVHHAMTAQEITETLDDDHQLFLYVAEGLLKGYLYLVYDRDNHCAEIKYFSSHSDYRLKGIAFDLIQHAIYLACTRDGLDSVHFKIRSKNHELVSRFDTLGFHIKHEYHKFKCCF